MKSSRGKVFVEAMALACVVATGVRAASPGAEPCALAEANNRFALALYGRLEGNTENRFFSPYSVSTALAMTHAGARGDTARQMAEALRFDLESPALHAAFAALAQRMETIQESGEVQLAVANSLWPEASRTFRAPYLELVRRYYDATVTPLDYRGAAEEARRTINAWIEDRTRNKIRNMISSLDPLTRMVLVNAIYFKGDWQVRFSKEATEEQPFRTASGTTVRAAMMTFPPEPGRQRPEFGYRENERLQVLELPYVGNDLSMLVLLPREPDGLPEVEQALSIENLESWTGNLAAREVEVHFPRFKITWGTRDLTAALAGMGMKDAFHPARANFSGMDGRTPGAPDALYISQVLHKAFVEVNEEGTEAAAATAVVMRMTSAMPRPRPVFRADHPFLFLIRERRTGSILFMGRVTDPTQETGD